MTPRSSDSAILILSCDKFQDIWQPFFRQFFKVWPDCPYQVYLGVNELRRDFDRVSVVRSGPDKDWSTSLKSILEKIEPRYLFVWLEDAFLLTPPDMIWMARAFDAMKSGKAVHIHFRPTPAPDTFADGFGLYQRGAPYRANVVGFWEKVYLNALLLPGETSWLFEIMGSYRTAYSDGFACVEVPLFDYLHLVEKGKWFPQVSEWNDRYALGLDLPARLQLEGNGRVYSFLKGLIFDLVSTMPWGYRVKLMHHLRRILASY